MADPVVLPARGGPSATRLSPPVARRRRLTAGGLRPVLLRSLGIGVLLVAWQIYGSTVNPLLFATPVRVAQAFVHLVADGELGSAALVSAQPFLAGLVLAVVVGIVVGTLLARFRVLQETTMLLVTGLYSIPAVALVPLLILWFGLGVTSKTAVVFLLAVFPVLFSTFDGIRSVSATHADAARAYGASEWQTVGTVTIPAALPFIMSGFRQSTGRALIGLIVGELFTGISGLGGMIVSYTNTLQMANVLAVVALLGVVGMFLMGSGTWLERKVAPWKETERAM
jgi:ABC-type nitrate/sulfonate/bicarbonate transport system permease component